MLRTLTQHSAKKDFCPGKDGHASGEKSLGQFKKLSAPSVWLNLHKNDALIICFHIFFFRLDFPHPLHANGRPPVAKMKVERAGKLTILYTLLAHVIYAINKLEQ